MLYFNHEDEYNDPTEGSTNRSSEDLDEATKKRIVDAALETVAKVVITTSMALGGSKCNFHGQFIDQENNITYEVIIKVKE